MTTRKSFQDAQNKSQLRDQTLRERYAGQLLAAFIARDTEHEPLENLCSAAAQAADTLLYTLSATPFTPLSKSVDDLLDYHERSKHPVFFDDDYDDSDPLK